MDKITQGARELLAWYQQDWWAYLVQILKSLRILKPAVHLRNVWSKIKKRDLEVHNQLLRRTGWVFIIVIVFVFIIIIVIIVILLNTQKLPPYTRFQDKDEARLIIFFEINFTEVLNPLLIYLTENLNGLDRTWSRLFLHDSIGWV